MTNRIIIDSDPKITHSTITLTGERVHIPDVMFPVSLEATYRDKGFYLTELQDRIRPDGFGVVLAKLDPKDNVTNEDGLNGLHIHALHGKPEVFEYMGSGITREVRSLQDLLKGSPYCNLGDDLVVEPTDLADQSFRYIFGNLKPTIENLMNPTNGQGLYTGKETVETFMKKTYGVEATQVGTHEGRFAPDGERNKLELHLGLSEEEGTVFRERLSKGNSESFELEIPSDTYEEEYAFDALRRYYHENGFKETSRLPIYEIKNGFVISSLFQHKQRTEDQEFVTTVVEQQSKESPATVRITVKPKPKSG